MKEKLAEGDSGRFADAGDAVAEMSGPDNLDPQLGVSGPIARDRKERVTETKIQCIGAKASCVADLGERDAEIPLAPTVRVDGTDEPQHLPPHQVRQVHRQDRKELRPRPLPDSGKEKGASKIRENPGEAADLCQSILEDGDRLLGPPGVESGQSGEKAPLDIARVLRIALGLTECR